MLKSCTRSSHVKFQHGEGSAHQVLLLAEELSTTEAIKVERISIFRNAALKGYLCSSRWSYTQEYGVVSRLSGFKGGRRALEVKKGEEKEMEERKMKDRFDQNTLHIL